ncbi:type VI secretion system membrane subunit TssM [Roseibium polysiphoniae]|uniref:type VI secretion system membrane subunit TssM n=2 Tax=Alphaproteobacteria TaxID=28211 RepID=UPI003298C88B
MLRTYFASLFRALSLIILFVLIACSLLIWFFGGYVTIGGVTPFQETPPRLIAIVGLFTAFFAITFIRHVLARRSNAKLINSMLANDELVSMGNDLSSDEVELIRERFEAALKKLKDNPLDGRKQRNYLSELPWYIIIGPPGTGKTTILRNSGLEFPLADSGQEALQGIGGTRNCDWWISNEAVLIDTAGRYTTQDVNKGIDAAAWSGFLDLLVKFRRRRPINGVMLAISIEDVALAGEEERARQADTLRQRLRELHRVFGMRLPVYVMFTKCDLIAGFDEYFDAVKEDEREQVWGVTFPYDDEQVTVGPAFETNFIDLVSRLERQIPAKLSEERNNSRRCRIYGFPYEFGSLSQVLRGFLTDVFRSSRYEAQPLLRGVYFTSGTQEGTPFDRLLGAMGRSFSLSASQQLPLNGQGKAYFIKNLLTDIIFPEQNLVGKNTKVERRLAALYAASLAGLAACVVGLSLYWLSGLYYSQEVVERAEENTELVSVRLDEAKQNRSLVNILPTLNAAEKLRDDVANSSNWLTGAFFSVEGESSLYPAADEIYHSILLEYLLPSISSRLATQIQLVSSATDGNSVLLRDQLETYLMLTTGQNFDPSKVGKTFKEQNEAAFVLNPQNRAAMQEHMDTLVTLLPAVAPADVPIVEAARTRIQKVPQASDIYNRMVADAVQRYRLAPIDIVRVLGSGSLYVDTAVSSGQSIIQGLYTKNGFYNFFLPRLPQYIRESIGTDWVLGNDGLNDQAYNKLANQIVKLYTDDYVSAWRGGVTFVRVIELGSLGRAQIVLQDLSSPQSPLTNLLSVLRENTQLPLPGDDTDPAAAAVAGAAPPAAGGLVTSATDALKKNAIETAFGDAPWPGLKIEEAFRPLINLADPSSGQAALDRVQQLFGDLYGNVSGIVTAPDPNKAAFDFVSKRVKSPTSDAFTTLRSEAAIKPEPVRSLVLSIVNRTWQLMMKSSYLHVNGKWQDEVVPVCNSIMTGRYPFTPSAEEDVALQDFTELFGPAGIIDTFFKENLSPFVTVRGRQYAEVTSQGVGLGLASGSLAQMSTAQTIREAFFGKTGTTPETKFTIQPTFLDPNALRSVLKIDDEQIVYRHGPERAQDFAWPSKLDASVAELSITLLDNSKETLERTGTWAIFRMLTASGLSKARGRDQFVFSIETEGAKASYRLNAGSVTNPFNLGLYSSFRCPPAL